MSLFNILKKNLQKFNLHGLNLHIISNLYFKPQIKYL
jgi:hypothetical protein